MVDGVSVGKHKSDLTLDSRISGISINLKENFMLRKAQINRQNWKLMNINLIHVFS